MVLWSLWVLAFFLPIGCTSSTREGSPSASTLDVQPTLRIRLAHAARYDDRTPVALEGVARRIYDLLQATAVRLGKPPPQTDEAIQDTSREICHGLPSRGPPPPDLVEFALRASGIVDPPPHFLIAEASLGGEEQMLSQLRPRLDRILKSGDFLRVGIGVARHRTRDLQRVVIALLESRVRFLPFSRTLRRGERLRLRFVVREGWRKISIVIADGGSAIRPSPLDHEGGAYVTTFLCDRPGAIQVEVTGEGRFGAEVLANFPLYCDCPAPTEVSYVPAAAIAQGTEELERDIFSRTNRAREERGLPPLRFNPKVAEVAREHCVEMRDARFIGHISPSTGSPSDRLKRAGVIHLVARENVARAYSPQEVMGGLLQSPVHRENLLSTDVTELGVGVVIDRGGSTPVLLVTQDFISPGTPFDPVTAPREILGIIDRRRRVTGLPDLEGDAELHRLAVQYVKTAIQHDGNQSGAEAELSRALQRMGRRFKGVEGVFLRVGVLDTLAQAKELQHRGPTHVGIGVEPFKGELVLFILMAEARRR
jgi:uncharacterized protein YkwD